MACRLLAVGSMACLALLASHGVAQSRDAGPPPTSAWTSARRLGDTDKDEEIGELRDKVDHLRDEIESRTHQIGRLRHEIESREGNVDQLLERINDLDNSTKRMRAGQPAGASSSEWLWQTWVWAMLLGLLVLVCLCCSCFFSCVADDRTAYSEVSAPRGADTPALIRFCRREMRLMLLYPLIPITLAPWTTCRGGMPTWGYALYLPFLVRTKWNEHGILTGGFCMRTSEIVLSIPFVLSSLDHLDWYTDGAFPVQAWMCDAQVTEPFAQTFRVTSFWWPVAPLVSAMHFYGISYVVLAIAAFAQQAAAMQFQGKSAIASSAEVAGMGALAAQYDQGDGEAGAMSSLPFRVLLENCLQMWLQASFFGLTFQSTGP